jgi:hypothetical protein
MFLALMLTPVTLVMLAFLAVERHRVVVKR